jgi:hypothetical protein
MATSDSYDFTLNTYEVIAGALRLLGAIQSGETPPADEYVDARKALNGVIKTWSVNNVHVWTQTNYSTLLTVGQAEYLIGFDYLPRPLKITEARLRVAADDSVIPLIPMSRLDFANLTQPIEPGLPQYFFYDPQIPFGKLSLYPPPATLLYSLWFIGQRPIQDADSVSDTMDVPAEWIAPLRFALAVELAAEYDCPKDRFEILKIQLDEKLALVRSWDMELQGTTTLPFSQGIYQLISGALRLCGGCGAQETPSLGLVNNAFYALNAMVQAWQASGIHVWAEETGILFLQPDQIRYQLGAGSSDHATLTDDWVQTALTANAAAAATSIVVSSISGIASGDHIGVWLDSGDVFWTTVSGAPSGSTVTLLAALTGAASSGAMVVAYTTPLVRPLRVPSATSYLFAVSGGQPITTPMSVLSRIDYLQIPNPTTSGVTTQFFFDPQLDLAVINVWPAPSNAQRAVQFVMQRPLTTFASLSAVADFPPEWNAALRWKLAVEIWPEHTERRASTKAAWDYPSVALEAAEKLRVAQSWDREPESIYFGLENMAASRN